MTDHFKGFAEKRYTCTFYDDACLKKLIFSKLLLVAIFCKYICALVLTDLLDTSCQ